MNCLLKPKQQETMKKVIAESDWLPCVHKNECNGCILISHMGTGKSDPEVWEREMERVTKMG